MIWITFNLCAQQDSIVEPKVFSPDFKKIDSLYREDQFYFSFTYNIISKMPEGMSQNKFSLGLSGGFLRDFPINEKRNRAIAVGLGYTLQNYHYNLVVSDATDPISYSYIGNRYSDKNKLSLNYLDVPIEFRWRTSTAESHKFWRIYTGLKISYLFNSRSKFAGDGGKMVVVNNKDLNQMRYSAYLSAGYNTWNFYACYGLNPIYKKGEVNGKTLDMTNLSLGLMFYIL